MRMRTTLFITAALLLAGGTVATASPSMDGFAGQGPAGSFMLVQNDGPSLSEAVEQVRRQYNGRIVSAETRMSGNREVHYIKVLTEDGKVKTVRVNGRTRRS